VYFEEFRDYMEIDREKSSKTLDSYISDLRQFFNFVDKDIKDVKQRDIVNYKKWLREKGIQTNTINRKLSALNGYFGFLNEMKGYNLTFKFKKEKVVKQKYLEEMLTKTDYKRILGAAQRRGDTRAVAMLEGLYLTGMRISELLQYKTADVGKEKITIIGKGSKERKVFIPDELNKALKEYLEDQNRKPCGNFLFTTRNGSRLNRQMADYIIKYYGAKAKVKLTKCHVHNLRHLFSIICIRERGLTIDELADLIGHVDINITRIYTRRTEAELLRLIKRMN
jgi:integrase/recombinase XerD